jgi:DNA adenine methylase
MVSTKQNILFYTSPLRYPGGKGMLSKFIKSIITENNLFDGHYVELYAGGAGIAWSLLFEEYVRIVHINDINKSLYKFWKSVLENTEELCRKIHDTPVTIKEWYRQKEIQRHPYKHSDIDLGFSTFFLNRTNRSGILCGGVIGGKNQQGKWKINARFNKKDLIDRIKRIARYKERVRIYNLDAEIYIKKVLPKLSKKTLVFIDPPYYVKGKGLYEDHYSHSDHVNVAKLVLRQIKHPWIVSYDAAPEIIALYKKVYSVRYNMSYSAQEHYTGSEVMFFSKQLKLSQKKLNPVFLRHVI